MANGTLKVSNIETSSGSGTITIGQSGETITIPSGATVSGAGANSPAFRAKLGSNQTVSDATSTKVGIDTEEYDTDSAFDTSTSRFTVPSNQAGKYFFGFQMWCFDANAGTSNFAQIFLRKNGSTLDPTTVRVYGAFSNHNLSFANTAVLDLSVGDYVEFWSYLDFSTSTFTIKADQTAFSGYKLIG